MDELSFYNGAHTGEEIDVAVDYANKDGVVVVHFELTALNETYISNVYDIPVGDGIPVITARHQVVDVFFSHLNALLSDAYVFANDNKVGFQGTIKGFTAVTVVLAKAPKDTIYVS